MLFRSPMPPFTVGVGEEPGATKSESCVPSPAAGPTTQSCRRSCSLTFTISGGEGSGALGPGWKSGVTASSKVYGYLRYDPANRTIKEIRFTTLDGMCLDARGNQYAFHDVAHMTSTRWP